MSLPDFKEIQIGEQARIVGYDITENSYRRKLLSMGLTRGTVFTLTRIAPMGDPVEIEIMGYKLTLRRSEADILRIERVIPVKSQPQDSQ